MTTTSNKPQTQPRLQALPQSSPSPEGTRIVDMSSENARLVAEVIAKFAKNSPTQEIAPAVDLSPTAQALIALAARNLPGWAKYLMGAGGGVIALQLVAIWGLPQRVEQIELTQKKQGELLAKVACAVGAGPCEGITLPTSRPTR